ncbi:type I secretion system permease/ATPase [Salinispirillum sp. LH 10-3-1]|uniref:Type I secretion system permease/ATPase n=1 Tax=Salinispirillum sp. LH 10-3-1 TaxID=2952525 RepID=A0AB38YHH9_9GAMM
MTNQQKPEQEQLGVKAAEQPDALAECLYKLAQLHGRVATRDALLSGLPLVDGRLTPDIFPRSAQRAGLSARAVKSSLTSVNKALLPAVLILESNQACLLMQIDPKAGEAWVIYPELSDSVVRLPMQDLQEQYTERLLYVQPEFRFDSRTEQATVPAGEHWFWGVMKNNRRLYVDVLIAAVLINLLAVAMPLFVMNVYDRVVPNQAIETLWVLAIGVFLVLCADLALRTTRTWFVDHAAKRADRELSARIMSRVLGMRLDARPQSAGSFAALLQSFESVRGFIGSAVVVALVDLPFVVLFAIIIAMISPSLVIPVVVGSVLVLTYALLMQGAMRNVADQSMRANAQRNATLVESLVGLETVKSFQAEQRLQSIWERTTAYLADKSARNRFFAGSIGHVALWMQHTVAVAIIVIGVYLVGEGVLTQGGLVAAYLLSSRAMGPVSQASSLLGQYHQASTALRGLNQMMDTPLERPVDDVRISRPLVNGEVEFRQVSFRYPGDETDVLRNVSFKILAGEHVAVLGRNGSGKSTIEKLMLGLYQPTGGTVTVDGVDLRQFDPAELRRNIGYVPQDITLFYGSVRDNVVMAFPTATDEEVLRAGAMSGLATLTDQHPMGYNMPVGERGERLSGGQRQSVALARAMIRQPNLLLLDEPTGAMDHSSEEDFKTRLSAYAKGRTMLVITHRTSLLELVDRIIVIDRGVIVADGPKDQVVDALRHGRIGKAS